MPTNDFVDRVSTLDAGYASGDLSVYPKAVDTLKELYQARNNAETALAHTAGYTSRILIVDDASRFPPQGLLRLGDELVYYDSRTATQFRSLKRGFGGSRQGQWATGTKVVNAVMAEPHNAVKDAIVNMEGNLGLQDDPAVASLNGILKKLEQRFLSPKPIFRASPLRGQPPLVVTFQNFSGGDPIRYLWDFGDGATSIETAPTHTYVTEGKFTVKLNMITSLGAQGITVKTDYIEVDGDLGPRFFYTTPQAGAAGTTVSFIDQTTGDVASRYWLFDDGEREEQNDPDIHYTSHTYSRAGEYEPTLIVVFKDQHIVRLQMPEPIIIT